MDAVALGSVITLAVLGLATSSIAVWTTRQNISIARENRAQQRLADGYVKVLSLSEHEGQWINARVYNFSLDREAVHEGKELEQAVPPEPVVADQATAAALIAALGSALVRERYTAWRLSADAAAMWIREIDRDLKMFLEARANVPQRPSWNW